MFMFTYTPAGSKYAFICISRTWKSKLKKKIVEKWKHWMVLDYYEKTPFSYSPFSLLVSLLSECVYVSHTPLWLQPHFCHSLSSLSIFSALSFFFSPAPSSVPLSSSSSLSKAVPQIIHHSSMTFSHAVCQCFYVIFHLFSYQDDFFYLGGYT